MLFNSGPKKIIFLARTNYFLEHRVLLYDTVPLVIGGEMIQILANLCAEFATVGHICLLSKIRVLVDFLMVNIFKSLISQTIINHYLFLC